VLHETAESLKPPRRPTSRRQVHDTGQVRRNAWRIVCAGGYFAAGFQGTIGHSDVWNRIDAPNRYTFSLQDEGAPAQLGYLHGLFGALPFSRMQPFADVTGDAVALAEPGTVYVVYLPHGGAAAVELPGPGEIRYGGRWYNPRTGEFVRSKIFEAGGGRQQLTAPDTNDWVVVLERQRP